MRVLITGANGFIGRALCDRFRLVDTPFREAIRGGAAFSKPDIPSTDRVTVGDINSSTDWRAGLDGVTHVVHLAGHTHALGESAAETESRCRIVNVEGTVRLAEQAAAAGVQRFVFLSSVKAAAERSLGRRLSEDDQPAPGDAYGASKLAAERALAEVSGRSGMGTVVLRPPLVYGPGVRANFLRLLRLVDRGIPLPLGRVHNRRSFVYLGNLVSAVEACIFSPAAVGQTFFVSDGEDVSTPELIRRIAFAMSRRVWLPPAPVWLLRAGARLAGVGPELGRLVDSLAVDSAKLRGRLGWKPPFTLDQGLRETLAWYRISARQ